MTTKTKDPEPIVAVHKKKADDITTRRSLYAAGAGLIPVPLLDLATLLTVQVLMIRDIAAVYGQESNFKKNRIKNFVTTLVGDLATVGVFSGIKFIPIVGSVVGLLGAPLTGAAATYALGKVFTQHFDQGGTLLDFDPETSRAYFQEQFEKGKEVVKNAK